MDAFLDRAISAVEITWPEIRALVPGGDFVRGATDLLMAGMTSTHWGIWTSRGDRSGT